jgi:uncharacterized protein with WD repeat
MGVALWGGPPPFEKPLMRFEHANVLKFDFSPSEKFLVTASVKGKAEGDFFFVLFCFLFFSFRSVLYLIICF